MTRNEESGRNRAQLNFLPNVDASNEGPLTVTYVIEKAWAAAKSKVAPLVEAARKSRENAEETRKKKATEKAIGNL